MDNRLIKYNRSFLNKKYRLKTNQKYQPKFHIFGHHGLINDPNCLFYKNEKIYCFFQHHPNNNLHGLKTMSLAIVKNFVNFDYKFMVNKPTFDFESHGVFSGNTLLINNKPICLYTGNKRDCHWNRISSVIKCEYDFNQNQANWSIWFW